MATNMYHAEEAVWFNSDKPYRSYGYYISTTSSSSQFCRFEAEVHRTEYEKKLEKLVKKVFGEPNPELDITRLAAALLFYREDIDSCYSIWHEKVNDELEYSYGHLAGTTPLADNPMFEEGVEELFDNMEY